MSRAGSAKKLPGWTLLLGLLVLNGGDKVLETLALPLLPDWAVSI